MYIIISMSERSHADYMRKYVTDIAEHTVSAQGT